MKATKQRHLTYRICDFSGDSTVHTVLEMRCLFRSVSTQMQSALQKKFFLDKSLPLKKTDSKQFLNLETVQFLGRRPRKKQELQLKKCNIPTMYIKDIESTDSPQDFYNKYLH